MRPLEMHVGAMMEKLVCCHGNTEHSGMNWPVFRILCIVFFLFVKDLRHTAPDLLDKPAANVYLLHLKVFALPTHLQCI